MNAHSMLVAAATIGLKATLVLALAAAVDSLALAGRASAATRHLLWATALGALLVLPLAAASVPAWNVPLGGCSLNRVLASSTCGRSTESVASRDVEVAPLPPVAESFGPRDASLARRTHGTAGARDGASVDRGATPATFVNATRTIPWAPLVLAVYLAGVVLLLARMAAQRVMVRRLERAASPIVESEWRDAVRTIAAALGVRRDVTILRGGARVMPMTWGLRRATVLLPGSAAAWSDERRQAVLLHELAHVARHDCLTQTLASITCALYWPHPGAWWAASRLHEERELACDDRALAHGVGAHEYAEHQLEIAASCRIPYGTRSLAVSMAAPGHLESRLLAAIDARRPRGIAGRRSRVTVVATAIALLLPLAAVRDGVAAQGAQVRAAVPALPTVSVPRPADTSVVPDSERRTPSGEGAVSTAPQGFTGEWRLRPTEGNEPPNSYHVMLLTPGLNTFYEPTARFEGLAADAANEPGGTRQFTLKRDAGTFTFVGSFERGRGTGRFTFAGSETFADALAKRGVGRPSPAQLFSLGRHDVTLAYLDELAAQGYAVPDLSTLDRAGMSGADLAYVHEMAGLGYRLGTLEALLHASNADVTPAYVRAMEALGYGRLPVAELVALRNHSLDEARVAAMNARAGRRLTVVELLRMRMGDDGESPSTSARDASPPPAPPVATRSDTPTEGRWTIASDGPGAAQLELFWTDSTNWRRTIAVPALQGLADGALTTPATQAVAFSIAQDAGRMEFTGTAGMGRGTGRFRFTPNRAFVSTLRSLGVRDVGEVSDHTLKNLTWGGMSAASIRELADLGYPGLALGDVTSLAVRLVTPEWVRGLKEAGVRDLTIDALEDLRMAGVTPEYVREMAGAGYRGLSARELVELRRAGVTAAFVRARAPSGSPQPPVDELAREARRRARG